MPDALEGYSTALSMGAAALILFTAHGIGSWLLQIGRCLPDTRLDRALYSLALGAAILASATLVSAAAGYGRPDHLFGLMVALSVVAGIHLLVRPKGSPMFVFIKSLRTDLFSFSLFILMAAIGLFNLSKPLAPSTHDDSLTYHLGIPWTYLHEGRIVPIPGHVYSNWQFLAQYLNLLGLALGGYATAQLVHYVLYLCIPGVLFSIGRRHFSARIGIVAACIFMALSNVKSLSGTATDMFLLTLMAVLGIKALMEWMHTQERRWLILACLFTGLCAGTKLYGLLPALCLGLLFAVRSIRLWGLGKAFPGILIFAAVSLVVASPGYIKNAVLTGNPVYPYLNSIFPTRDWNDAADREMNRYHSEYGGRTRSLKDFALLPYRAAIWRSAFSLWAIPLLLLVRPFPSPLKWLLAYVALFALGWFWISQQSRLMMPAHAVLALVGAAALAISLKRLNRLPAMAATVLLLALLSYDVLFRNVKDGLAAWHVVADPSSRWNHVLREHPDFSLWHDSSGDISRDTLYLSNDPRTFYLNRPWITETFHGMARWKNFHDPDEAAAHIRTTGATVFFLNLYRSDYIDRANMDRFLERHARLMGCRNATYLFDLTGTRGKPYKACEALTGRVTVRSSSRHPDRSYPPEDIVDGVEHRSSFDATRKTGWMSLRQPTPTSPEWIEIDFERPVRLNALRILSYPHPQKTLESFTVTALGAKSIPLLWIDNNETETEWLIPNLNHVVSKLRIDISASHGPARVLEVRAAFR